jgi:thioredoxin-like negative regulator of GroEL
MEFVGHTISGSPGSSPSSDDEGWQDDVAEDLNTFVRLSKAGHFTRAEDFFRAFLESYAGDFAVAAQYAENLIEQGSFGSAEKFLTAWLLKDVNVNVEERTVVRLFLGTARIYTRSEEREAARNDYAATCLQSVGQVLIAEDMSPLKVSDRSHS